MKPRYEILDDMETVVATADSFDDALHAADKYRPAMVYRTDSGKVVYWNSKDRN